MHLWIAIYYFYVIKAWFSINLCWFKLEDTYYITVILYGALNSHDINENLKRNTAENQKNKK